MLQRALVGLLVVLAGCPRQPPTQTPIPPVSSGKVRVRVFTEPSPVRLLASAGRFVFVATDGNLERWDSQGGVVPLSAQHGLSGKRIVALAPDLDRRWVWVLTDAGLGRYDVSAEVFHQMPAAPAGLGLDFAALAVDGASVAPATDGGAWLGTRQGLVAVSAEGTWTATTLKDPIHGLVRDHAGWLWIATKAGLVTRKPSGDLVRIGPLEGLGIVDPRLLVELPGDRMLVIGADDTGRDRVAFGKQLQWLTYRALPEVKWDAAARRGNGAVLMAGERVYRISPVDPTRVRPLARDGMRLVPLAGKHAVDWVIDPVDLVVPPGAMTLAAFDDQLLIGTRELGTARYRDGQARPHDWLRRRQMFLDASTLSVACARQDDCWIATGTRQAWHWNGDRFAPRGPDDVVLAVVRDPGGAIYALHRAASEPAIRVSKIEHRGATAAALEDATWTPLPRLTLATAGSTPRVSFARFASPGTLWIGLRDHEGGEEQAASLAVVDVAGGKVTYPDAGDVGILDGDVQGDTAWFVTEHGVARLGGGKLEEWPELARAVAIGGDAIYAATETGVARFDGTRWELPPALGFEILDLVATQSGQLWMATRRGIAAWDGQKLRRVDTRRGLAENVIHDVATDQFDRVWARGPGSLTLISQ